MKKNVSAKREKDPGCLLPTIFLCISLFFFYRACENGLPIINGFEPEYVDQYGVPIPEEIERDIIEIDPVEQQKVIDASIALTKYKSQIEDNEFIHQVDHQIKEVLYEGYDMEYFYFHEFRADIVAGLYQIFFEQYNFFTPQEQERLLSKAQTNEIHTWNSKKKELAIYGHHLELLAQSFGKNSSLFTKYKEEYISTGSIAEAVNKLLPKTLRNSEITFEKWEKIKGKKLSNEQKIALSEIFMIEQVN